MVFLPAVILGAGLLIAYGSAGRFRQAATLAVIAAAAWSLALLIDPGMTAWAIGPIVATLFLPRGRQRPKSSFEGLTRRAITVAATMVAALFLASHLRVGENPLLLSAVTWFLLGLGAAWFASPIDEPERLQGQVLMVAGAAGVILAAVPTGAATAGVAGAMALMPILGERTRLPGRLRPALTVVFLLAAGAALVLAAIPVSISRLNLFDLSLGLGAPALLATAILLVAGAAVAPVGTEWAALLGTLAVIANAPAVRWPALAALTAVATVPDRRGERPAWLAGGLLAITPVLQALGFASWSARAEAVGLAGGLVLMLFATRMGPLRVLLLPATTLVVMFAITSVSPANLARFQWIVAVGGLLLIGRTLLTRLMVKAGPPEIVRDPLILGLLLLAISARDSLGLGELAVALLLIDLALVHTGSVIAPAIGWAGGMIILARSNWPPSVAFAGAALAAIAALQAGLALGLLAALILGALQLAPLLDRHLQAPTPERPRSAMQWIGPLLSIAGGIAPALVLRMLRA